MNLWHDIKPGNEIPNVINVIVEIPKGSQNKYEHDKENNLIKLDRVLFSPLHYPGDYGMIPPDFIRRRRSFRCFSVSNKPDISWNFDRS